MNLVGWFKAKNSPYSEMVFPKIFVKKWIWRENNKEIEKRYCSRFTRNEKFYDNVWEVRITHTEKILDFKIDCKFFERIIDVASILYWFRLKCYQINSFKNYCGKERCDLEIQNEQSTKDQNIVKIFRYVHEIWNIGMVKSVKSTTTSRSELCLYYSSLLRQLELFAINIPTLASAGFRHRSWFVFHPSKSCHLFGDLALLRPSGNSSEKSQSF